MDEPEKNIKWKKPDIKEYLLYDFTYTQDYKNKPPL